VLDDYETAPVSEPVRATLAYLRKLTLAPEDVGPDDARAVLAADVSEAALVDAVYVCALFNVMDRVADALGFAVPADFGKGAGLLLARGYKM
jgi:alkylhydroperoxidase family enzyme